jgi:tyrosine-protein kinase Etk/Wzc
LHLLFGIPSVVGLSSVLRGETRLEHALHGVPGYPLLRVLPAGPPVANPAALLHGPSLQGVFDRLKPETDLLILDMPSVRVVSYTAYLASLVDATLLVVRSGTTPVGASRMMERRLKGARVIGAVLNKVPTDTSEVASYRDYAVYKRKRRAPDH